MTDVSLPCCLARATPKEYFRSFKAAKALSSNCSSAPSLAQVSPTWSAAIFDQRYPCELYRRCFLRRELHSFAAIPHWSHYERLVATLLLRRYRFAAIRRSPTSGRQHNRGASEEHPLKPCFCTTPSRKLAFSQELHVLLAVKPSQGVRSPWEKEEEQVFPIAVSTGP